MTDTPNSGVAPALSRDSWASRVWAGVTGDIRYAARRLAKEPGFASVALLTLALCIGANTAIFSLVYTLVLKPLPFPEPGRIVEIYNAFPKDGFNHFPTNVVQYSDFKANTTAFDDVALCGMRMVMVGDVGSSERIPAAYCTAEMFDVLGVRPVIGQFFTLKNSREGEDNVVVLTESYWKSHYNEDPGVLGKSMRVNDKTLQIIGVAPRSLEAFDARARFVAPYSWKPADVDPQNRYSCSTPMYARMKAGVPISVGLAQVAALEKRYYDAATPDFKSFLDNTGHRIAVGLVQAERVQPIKSSLYLLQGGVIFVLLIGCVNVANLLLTRANGQQSELAVRAALGAGRGAIARQLLVESLLMTLLGALLGVMLAYGAVRAINHFTAKLLPNMIPVVIDGSVLGLVIAVAVVVGLVIGVVPVVHILRSNLAQVIQRSSRGASSGRGVRALSSVLVTGQVAVALVLLSGAGLLIHSFAKAVSVDPGFDPKNLVVGSVALPAVYGDKAKSAAFQLRLTEALKEIPGVEGAALATGIPFEGGLPINALTLKDSLLPADASQPGAFLIGVSPDYFRTLRIQLLSGRYFDETDSAKDARRAFIVDELFAQRFYPGHPAVGGHFSFDGIPKKDSDWPVIVGVVRNVPHNGVEDKSNNPFAYYPLATTAPGGLNIFVRSSRPLGDLVSSMREKLRGIDPSVPLFETDTMEKAIAGSVDSRRAVMLLLGGFAGLALFLSAIGIYGVLAYDISQRTREIGIRGAIGASRRQIVGHIMVQGLWKTGVGLAVGLVAAVLLSHYMESMLFGVKPSDPWSYILVSALLASVAAAACYIPARRASRIDPMSALRTD